IRFHPSSHSVRILFEVTTCLFIIYLYQLQPLTSLYPWLKGTVSLQIFNEMFIYVASSNRYFLLLLIKIDSGTDSNLNISQSQLKNLIFHSLYLWQNGNEFYSESSHLE
ncbi:hypothetical protein Ccrd_002914, partial [Cynara cardunculus var. scolymus]